MATTTAKGKTALFIMRLSPREKEILQQAAEKSGISLAGFLRSNGLAAAATEREPMAA
jgi:uncharacterized protein (DUF1778 family)